MPAALSDAGTGTRIRARASTSAADATPPEAMTGMSVDANTWRNPSTSGPANMPSRAMEVTTTAATPAPSRSSSTWSTVRPLRSSHPRTATSVVPSAPRW